MSIQPNEDLYRKKNIVDMNGIVEVRPTVAFKQILQTTEVANIASPRTMYLHTSYHMRVN